MIKENKNYWRKCNECNMKMEKKHCRISNEYQRNGFVDDEYE